eukprot:Ihof_evm1s1120 gene=Ihof_evmTU1s1120
METNMELYVWPPSEDGQLKSYDPFCLQVMAYIRFSDAPVEIKYSNNPKLSPTEQFPYLINGSTLIGGVTPIITYLQSIGYDTNCHLTNQQKGEAYALCVYIDSSLVRKLVHDQWKDANAYHTLRLWLVKQLVFPLNYTVPRAIRQILLAKYINHVLTGICPTPQSKLDKVTTSVANLNMGSTINTSQSIKDSLQNDQAVKDVVEPIIMQKVLQCVNDLGLRLEGECAIGGPLFYGKRPTTTDAMLYGLMQYTLNNKDSHMTELNKILSDSAPLMLHYNTLTNGCVEKSHRVSMATNLPEKEIPKEIDESFESQSAYGYQESEDEWLAESLKKNKREQEMEMERKRNEEISKLAYSKYITYALAGSTMILYGFLCGFIR